MSHKQKQHIFISREGRYVLCLALEKGHEKLEAIKQKIEY